MPDIDRMVDRLRQDTCRATWPEPDQLRRRGARRGARRAASVAAAAVAVLAAGSVGTVVALRNPGGGVQPPPASSPASPGVSGSPPATGSPVPTGTPPGSPTVPAGGKAAGPTNGPFPGYTMTDLSFPSRDNGWVLGSRPCAPARCPVLLRTTDGGRTWSSLPVPVGLAATGGHVRFADSRIGYLYGADVLYASSDGGASWAEQPGWADALEVGGGTVLRVAGDRPHCAPGCTYRVFRASIGSTAWRQVGTVPGYGAGVQLLRSGHRAYLGVYPNPAGGARAPATLLTSSDDGATWTTRADPCPGAGSGDGASMRMALAPGGALTMLCLARAEGSGQRWMVTTTTGDMAPSGRAHATPADPLAVGAASATTLFVSAVDGRGYVLYRSADGGATWGRVATSLDPVPDGDVPAGPIRFVSGETGHWLPGFAAVHTTSDAGRTWTPHTFP